MVPAVLKSRYGRIQRSSRRPIYMKVARFRKRTDLVREGKMFVKNKAEVPSGVHGL